MPRKPRVEFAGAVYHVMCRGDRGEAIFRDDYDRRRFLETLAEVRERTGWRLHAYVLMGNHYHWLLETPEPNLVAGMRWFQGTYTARFNHRHGVYGHLFQGRYKALPVSPDEQGYFLQVSSYIHLNPARARLLRPGTDLLSSYPWSSFPEYVKPPRRRREGVDVERVLDELGVADDTRGRAHYRDYLERVCADLTKKGPRTELEEAWRPIRRGWYLGSEQFRDRVQRLVDTAMGGHAPGSYSGSAAKAHNQAVAEELLASGLKALGMTRSDLGDLKKLDGRKRVLAWWVRGQTMVSNAWVADVLHMGHPGNVSRALQSVEEAATPDLRRWKQTVSALRDRQE